MVPSSDDIKLLEIMLEQGKLTPAQKHRVEKALATGKDLTAAVMATPVIEPLDLIRAKDQLHRSSGMVPKLDTHSEHGHVTTGSHDGISRDEDGVQVVDWEELDFRRTPVPYDIQDELAGNTMTAVAKGEATTDLLLPKEQFLAPGESGLTHDIAADDGIGLVRNVNRLLKSLIDSGHKAVQLAWTDEAALIADYDRDGRRIGERNEDAVLVDKMAAHLKVLARIQPWKEERQTGAFSLVDSGKTHRMIVAAEREPGQRKVTVFLD